MLLDWAGSKSLLSAVVVCVLGRQQLCALSLSLLRFSGGASQYSLRKRYIHCVPVHHCT